MSEMSETCADNLSAKALDFVKEIESVCIKHGIQLSVSDYDSFQIWPLKYGDPCLYAPLIEDLLPTPIDG